MKPKRRRVRRFFTRDWRLKLAALVLAALSFYAIRGLTGLEINYDVPLQVEVGKGVAILERETQTVQVTFRGSPEDLRRLEQKRLKAVLRPREVVLEGSETVPVGPRNIEGASGVTVVKVKPSAVALTFDREEEKLVSVEPPQTTGTPLIGRAELSYEPKSVTVRGPHLRLEKLESVTTEPVDVDGRVEPFSRTVRVLRPSDAWEPVIEPAEITVRVDIVKEIVTRKIENVPVLAIVTPESETDLLFDPPLVTVSIRGRPAVIDGIEKRRVKAFVDCVDLDMAATNRVPIVVHLPPVAGTVDVASEPETVRVIRAEPS